MNKRLLAVFLSIFMLVMTAGCGDGLKGMWITSDRSTFDGSDMVRLLYVDVADNGDYLIRDGVRYYSHDSCPITKMHVSVGFSFDEVLNKDEAFTYQGGFWGKYIWNGTEVKLAEVYSWHEKDSDATLRVSKKELTTKDGQLIFMGKTYKKADQNQFEKMKEDWKNRLKSHIGRKSKRYVYTAGEVQTRVARVVLVEKGKREVFEEGRGGSSVQTAENKNQPKASGQAGDKKKEQVQTADSRGGSTGVITGTEVRMRQFGNINSQILGYFNKGEKVTILESKNGWHKVQRADSSTGWVSGDFCKGQ